jgi:hypothetical protein
VFARDEYTGFLAPMKHGGYVAGLRQDFIRAYDGLPITMARTRKFDKKTGTRVDDTDRVQHPYLVKICAATRTAFIETATIEDMLDGLLARFVYTSGTAQERRKQRMTPQLDAEWRAVVASAQDFYTRAQAGPTLVLPDRILDLNWDLEREFKAAALAHPRPDAARPAMGRMAETVFKISALLALDRLRHPGPVAVTERDLQAAVRLAQPWKRTTLDFIADLGRTRFQRECDTVLATIKAAGSQGITRSKLYAAHRGLRDSNTVQPPMEDPNNGLCHGALFQFRQRHGGAPDECG